MTAIIKLYVATSEDTYLVTEDSGILERLKAAHSLGNEVSFCDSPNDSDIIIVCQRWSFKLPSYAQELLTDSFFCSFSKKIYVINYDDIVGEGFLPGCYVALRKSCYDPTRFRSVAYPKNYNQLITKPSANRALSNALFWFRGTLHSYPLRATLFDTLKDCPDCLMVDVTKAFHTHSDNDKQDYVDEMLNCDFVLCPRGAAPNSYRLYEAMSMGKCPVIISDEWVETVGPDWSTCSIRIAEKDLNEIPKILREQQKNAKSLGENAKVQWLKHFSDKNKNKVFIEQIVALYTQNKTTTKSLSDYKKHWRSRSFLRNNQWSLTQKMTREVQRLFIK